MISATNYAIIPENADIQSTFEKIQQVSKNGGEPGIAVVVNDRSKVIGVVTDGDLREAVCKKVSLQESVQKIMSKQYNFVYSDLDQSEQLRSALQQIRGARLNDPRLTQVVVCNRDGTFNSFANLFDLYRYGDITLKRVAIYGLGFVGLTLALSFAESQKFEVIGIDQNSDVVRRLRSKEPTFHERGLPSLLDQCVTNESISFATLEDQVQADIHIISVGTPLNEHLKPDFSFLETAGKTIGQRLKEGDLVICRSTVPVGTTRNRLIPILEKSSGLVAGKGFFVSFAPERTVEGNALKELRTLPQIVGGYSQQCIDLTAKLFETTNPTVIRVESLEAAELVKLMNNTFRDTVFAFANEVSTLCDQYNINSFSVIQAANEGYPRNPIPYPSPGVGGICLAKDSYLYKHSVKSGSESELRFGNISRDINSQMPVHVFEKFQAFLKSANLKGKTGLSACVVGIAFKGIPETSDMRYSPGLELSLLLKKASVQVQGWDAIVSSSAMEKEGIQYQSLPKAITQSHAAFFMNNHPDNTKFDVFKILQEVPKPFFFFDGWNMFSRAEIEAVPGVHYATLGYATPYTS